MNKNQKLTLLVSSYQARFANAKNRLLIVYKNLLAHNDVRTLVYEAALRDDDGHRKHIDPILLKNFALVLSNNYDSEISDSKTFDDIYNYVLLGIHQLRKIIGKHDVGIADLTEYDTSLRIGYALNIFPEKVYLQCGARIGAKYLFSDNEPTRLVSEFPIPLQTLPPYHIENFLCNFKKELEKIQFD